MCSEHQAIDVSFIFLCLHSLFSVRNIHYSVHPPKIEICLKLYEYNFLFIIRLAVRGFVKRDFLISTFSQKSEANKNCENENDLGSFLGDKC